jgi:hypothetical protein
MMSARTCENEAAVRDLVRSGQADPALREHVARCAACRETADVAAWMRQLAEFSADAARLPDPGQLWWKAQLLQRWDAQRRATEPIETGQQVQVGIGVAGCAGLLYWLWPFVQAWGARVSSADVTTWISLAPSALPTVIAIGGLLAAATALVAIRGIFAD